MNKILNRNQNNSPILNQSSATITVSHTSTPPIQSVINAKIHKGKEYNVFCCWPIPPSKFIHSFIHSCVLLITHYCLKRRPSNQSVVINITWTTTPISLPPLLSIPFIHSAQWARGGGLSMPQKSEYPQPPILRHSHLHFPLKWSRHLLVLSHSQPPPPPIPRKIH